MKILLLDKSKINQTTEVCVITKGEYNKNIHNTLSSQYHSEIKVLTSTYTTFNIFFDKFPKHIIVKIWNQQLNVQTQCTSAYSHLSFTGYKFFKQSYFATIFTSRDREEQYSKSNHIIHYNYEYKMGTKSANFTYATTVCS